MRFYITDQFFYIFIPFCATFVSIISINIRSYKQCDSDFGTEMCGATQGQFHNLRSASYLKTGKNVTEPIFTADEIPIILHGPTRPPYFLSV